MPKRKFREEWLRDEDFMEWIRKVDGDDYKAFCSVCRMTLVTEISTLKRHHTTRHHTDALALQAATPAAADEPAAPAAPEGIDDAVTRAEIKLTSFLAEHNISINSVDHLSEICKEIFPDSNIANKLSLKRTKATRVLEDIAKVSQTQIYDDLKENKFSMIIDETTDISTCKSCAIVVKFFNQRTGKIETKFLDLLSVYNDIENVREETSGSTGDHLFQMINDYFVKHNIPIKNLIGFAADGTSNIMGPHNSLTSRLRVVAPGITVLKCICHSVHLCASNAAKTLPRVCEDLIRNIYTYFSHSAKRKNEFQDFQSFCDVKPHKLLHVAQTRWLSLHMAVNRVLEQWQPLKLFFSQKHLEDRLTAPSNIYVALNDPSVLMYFKFLSFILPKFTQLNLMFQKKESTVHMMYKACKTLYKDTLRYYYKQDIINSTPHVEHIDPFEERNFVPLDQIYLGAELHILFQSPEYRGNAKLIHDVRSRCRTFLASVCLEMKKRFPFDCKVLEMCSVFSVPNCVDQNVLSATPSLSQVVQELPRVYEGDIQHLDDEWRSLPNLHIPDNLK